MSAQTYALSFNGCWREPDIGDLPARSGIYCVYAGKLNVIEDKVSLRELRYIGESANVRTRVSDHERWNDWKNKLRYGEELCFSAALIRPASDRERAEAAMINRHKPPCNVEYVKSFPFDQTTITTLGTNNLLRRNFTVYRSTGQVANLGSPGFRR